MDGIGAEQLCVKELLARLQDGTVLPIPRRAYESVNRAIIQMR